MSVAAGASPATPSCSGARCARARGLLDLGIGAGDRVALLLRNSIEYLEASIATVPLGASAVPINWHWRGEEIAHVLIDSRAKALVVHADLWPAIAPSVPEGVASSSCRRAGDGGAGVGGRGAARRRAPRRRAAGGPSGWPPTSRGRSRPRRRRSASSTHRGRRGGRRGWCARPPPTPSARRCARCSRDLPAAPGERTVIPAPMYHTAPNVTRWWRRSAAWT